MKIYVEMTRHALVFNIGDDELTVKIDADFYKKAKGQKAYKMFFEKGINEKIKKFVFKHRDRLSFVDKLKYLFTRNTVYATIDHEVTKTISTEVLSAYLTLSADASRVNFIPTEKAIL